MYEKVDLVGEKVKCGSNIKVEEEGFGLNNGADETKEEEGVIRDCEKENVTGKDYVNGYIQEEKSVYIHDEHVLPNLNNACNTYGRIRSSNVRKSYANVTDSKKNECDKNLKVIPTEIEENGNEVVIFNEMIVAEGSKRLELTLCGYFIDHRISMNELRYNLRRMWYKQRFKDVIDLCNGIYYMKFYHKEGLNYIVNNGSWMINNKHFVVQKWDINMSLDKTELVNIPLRIKLSNVPLKAWTTNGISALASRIDKLMVIDAVTTNMCKMEVGSVGYIRVLVEVFANKELHEHVEIVYKNGQNEDLCRKKVNVNGKKKQDVSDNNGKEKGGETSTEGTSGSHEEEDVYNDETGIGQSMNGDMMNGMDRWIFED
ncbi:zinc knuckle CX2CX4HX4C containing protein [Tanacetum coccineum]